MARVPVLHAWDEGPLMRGLRLGDLPPYKPGQAVKVVHDGRSAYFAIATAHGRGRAPELLLRRGGGVADLLVRDANAGSELEIEGPIGRGFAMEAARGKDVVLVAAGSAISAIRSVTEAIIDERDEFGRVTLFYGQERDAEFAYRAAHRAWSDAKVDVVLCARAPEPGWQGATGVVTDALVKRGVPDGASTVAFVCGMPQMVTDVKEALFGMGVTPERVLLNV